MTLTRFILMLALLATFSAPLHASESPNLDRAKAVDELSALAARLSPTSDSTDRCPPNTDVANALHKLTQVRHDWLARLTTRLLHGGQYSDQQVADIEGRLMGAGVMRALACRLQLRAQQLSDLADQPPDNQTERFTHLLDMTLALQENLSRHEELSKNSPEHRTPEQLAKLYQYAYGAALNLDIDWGGLSSGLQHMLTPPNLMPRQEHAFFARSLLNTGHAAAADYLESFKRGSELLQAYGRGHPLTAADMRHLTGWLAGVRHSWLEARPDANPCSDIHARISPLLNELVQQYGYPADLIGLSADYSEQRCYQPIHDLLAHLWLPPYGAAFIPDSHGGLQLQPELASELDAFTEAYDHYQSLAQRFNRDLAGRFPFAKTSAPDADPRQVKQFFRDFRQQRALLDRLRDIRPRSGRDDALRFLAQLDSLATLFSDTPTSQSATVPLQLAIQFRTRAIESQGSEQLIRWVLSSGSRSASYPNGNTRLDWYPGEGIVLSLNWADQSRWRPIPDSRQPDLVAEDQQASFLAQGAWSLFRMIALHRVTDHIVQSDEEVTLGFVIPTRLDAAANPAKSTSTRIYLALRSITPEPKIGLRFPYIAPMLD